MRSAATGNVMFFLRGKNSMLETRVPFGPFEHTYLSISKGSTCKTVLTPH